MYAVADIRRLGQLAALIHRRIGRRQVQAARPRAAGRFDVLARPRDIIGYVHTSLRGVDRQNAYRDHRHAFGNEAKRLKIFSAEAIEMRCSVVDADRQNDDCNMVQI